MTDDFELNTPVSGQRYKKVLKALSFPEDSNHKKKEEWNKCGTAVNVSTAICPQKMTSCARRTQQT